MYQMTKEQRDTRKEIAEQVIEECTCSAMAASGAMPPCSYCENSQDEDPDPDPEFGNCPRGPLAKAAAPPERTKQMYDAEFFRNYIRNLKPLYDLEEAIGVLESYGHLLLKSVTRPGCYIVLWAGKTSRVWATSEKLIEIAQETMRNEGEEGDGE